MASLKYKDPTTGEWKKVKISESYVAILIDHINDKTNPHKVTASQIGAPTYSYGTTDIKEGSLSSYENGHIHFVYEP